MELVARKADLVRELQFFQQIVERKNTIPILANVLIDTDCNSIRLLATDIEVTLTSSCEAAVDKPGAVTLPAKKLYEIVRSLPDGDVKLASTKDGNHITVSADSFESKMPTMPVGDFPTPPTSDMAAATTIASAPFRQLIARMGIVFLRSTICWKNCSSRTRSAFRATSSIFSMTSSDGLRALGISLKI